MTFWPAGESTYSMNCFASACSAGDALASMPSWDGSRVAGSRYWMPMFLSVNVAPIAAEDCTSARLIRPLASACSVGPLVGLMTRPLLLSVVKYFSPADTPPR